MGLEIIIATPTYALDIVDLICKLEKESNFMMYESNEIPSENNMRQRIAGGGESEVFLVAKKYTVPIGYLLLSRGQLSRNHGVGTLALGVLDGYKKQGIGSSLLREVISWAQLHNLYRLQLQVQTENEIAVSLYRKFSFEVEGVIKKASFVNGRYVDKLQMALLL